MRNLDPHISLLLDEVSTLLHRRIEVSHLEVAADSAARVSAPFGAGRLALTATDGLPLGEEERRLLQQIVELYARDASLRNEQIALSQRLRIVERENLDLSTRNRTLTEISSRDPLTGVFSRTYLLDKIDAEMNRALRHGSPMSLLLIDIDHLKDINDAHGHETGDSVLQQMGQLLRDSCRVYDVPGRYSGEQFCLMLPETRLENTMKVAERIRRRIEELQLQAVAEPLRITASIGVAGLDNIPDEAVLGPSSLIERADRALFNAKDRGRNRVETWSAAMVHSRRAVSLDH